MAQKTALQELLEWVRTDLPKDSDYSRLIEEKIEGLLGKEKDTIMGARVDGFKISGQGWNGEYPCEGWPTWVIHDEIDNEEYYNETFKAE